YRGIDDPKPADAMDLKAAVHHGSLVPESGHIRLPRVAAHPAGAAGVVAPSFVLDPFAQLRRVLLASGARLDLRLHAPDRGGDRADAFHGLAERLEIRLSATWRERIEVDVRHIERVRCAQSHRSLVVVGVGLQDDPGPQVTLLLSGALGAPQQLV